MPVTSLSASEKELNFFITRLQTGGIQQTAEIHEIDMGGWILFECFLCIYANRFHCIETGIRLQIK